MAPKDPSEPNGEFDASGPPASLWDAPSYRESRIRGSESWLTGKRQDDDTGGLWRVHDQLYDLTNFIDKHPGGGDWLRNTKGTDITEAFESHHLSERPRRMLEKFRVRDASGPRNSPYTFAEDGFYRTLKERARKELKVKDTAGHLGPTLRTKLTADVLLVTTIVAGCLATRNYDGPAYAFYGLGVAAAGLLTLLTVSGHNFLHQRDNFRMFYFDLSLMSSRDWRVSHALSHHLFPNTMLDLEVCLFEPFVEWLPKPTKGFFLRYLSWIYSPILWITIFYVEKIKRILSRAVDWTDVLPIILPLTFWASTGFVADSFLNVIYTWLGVVAVSSFLFGYMAFSVGHHHPEVFHAGDTPRKDKDWGLAQVDAQLDRFEVCNGVPEFSLVTFGNHSLHHLFPTVDNAHLPRLYPLFFQACKEFGKEYSFGNFWITTKGQFQQLANNKPNPNPPR